MEYILEVLEKDPERNGDDGTMERPGCPGYEAIHFFYFVGLCSQEQCILGPAMEGNTTSRLLKDKWAQTMALTALFVAEASDRTNILHNLSVSKAKKLLVDNGNDVMNLPQELQEFADKTSKRGKQFKKDCSTHIMKTYFEFYDRFKCMESQADKMSLIEKWERVIDITQEERDTAAERRSLGVSNAGPRKRNRDKDNEDENGGLTSCLTGRLCMIPGTSKKTKVVGDDYSTAASTASGSSSQSAQQQANAAGATNHMVL